MEETTPLLPRQAEVDYKTKVDFQIKGKLNKSKVDFQIKGKLNKSKVDLNHPNQLKNQMEARAGKRSEAELGRQPPASDRTGLSGRLMLRPSHWLWGEGYVLRLSSMVDGALVPCTMLLSISIYGTAKDNFLPRNSP